MKMNTSREVTTEQMKQVYTFNQDSLCLGRMILYKNIRELFLKMRISMSDARTFSPIGNKSIFGRFMNGHSPELVNMRFLLELIEAFDFSKEEVEAMLCTEVSFSETTQMQPFNKSQIPTKVMFGLQLEKLIGKAPEKLAHFSDRMQNQVRMAVAGKTYLDASVFIAVLLAYDLDPAEEILKLKNLVQYLEVDPDYQMFAAKNTDITTSEVLEDIEYLVQKHFEEETVFLVQNIQWAFDNFQELSPSLVEKLLSSSDADKKMENLLLFFSSFLKVSSENLLHERLEQAWREYSGSEEARTQSETPETEDLEEGLAMVQEVTINISGKYFVPCEKSSWKNENPNPNGEGFYWEVMPEDMIENIRMTLMRFDLMEASMNNVRKAVLKFCGNTQVKARIQVIGNGYELLFCCAN